MAFYVEGATAMSDNNGEVRLVLLSNELVYISSMISHTSIGVFGTC